MNIVLNLDARRPLRYAKSAIVHAKSAKNLAKLRGHVAHSPLGATAWSEVEARESGDLKNVTVETGLAPSPPDADLKPDSTIKQLTEGQN